ncbi:hypothetical protein D3C78_1315650 [compost metagenome]
MAAGQGRRAAEGHGAAPARQWRQHGLAPGRRLLAAEAGLPGADARLSRLRPLPRRAESAGGLSRRRRRLRLAGQGAGSTGQAAGAARPEPRRRAGGALPGRPPATYPATARPGARRRAGQLPRCGALHPGQRLADLAAAGAAVLAGAGWRQRDPCDAATFWRTCAVLSQHRRYHRAPGKRPEPVQGGESTESFPAHPWQSCRNLRRSDLA